METVSTPASTPTRRPRPAKAGTGWKGWGTLTWYSFWKMLTNPFIVGFAIGLPTFMYFMFGTGQDYSKEWVIYSNVAATVLVNMAIYGAVMTVSSMGANYALERTSGVSRLFAMTPLSPLAIIVSRLSAAVSLGAFVVAIVFAIGRATDARMEAHAWAGSFIMILVLSVLPAVIGLAFAFAVRSDGAFAATSGLTVVCSFGAGMFIPVEQMGEFMGHLAPWTPLYGLAKLSALPMYGWEEFQWEWLANFVIWTLLFALLAVWGQRRDTGR
ncbi:ABC transporter permease [Schaalia suimastitidis]|uniref:ABC transporter permease n=1 Tax=Schaalia suimastitidis TaxID=121163 RepID=UPI00041392E0|nr:ABC transporter permease [Schaalia suimastitidis]